VTFFHPRRHRNPIPRIRDKRPEIPPRADVRAQNEHFADTAAVSEPPKYRAALALLTLLFFMWGFITVLNDILIPHLKGVFQLSTTGAMFVQLAFFGAYFACSLPAGRWVEWVGYKWGIVLGLMVTGVGAVSFYPASSLHSYPLFLAALFVLATGITVLQVAANPYVTILGPPATAASRLNLTQGINSLGTTMGPYVGSILILDVSAKSAVERAQSVRLPYLAIALVLFALAAIFAAVRLPDVSTTDEEAPSTPLLQHRRVRLGIGAIFLYVGAEVAIGSLIVLFLSQPDVMGFPPEVAGKYVSAYWGAAMVGRFVGSALQQWVRPGRVLAFHALLAVFLTLLTVTTSGSTAMWSMLLIGFANSIMFPTIFSLSIAGLGSQTSRASSLLVMAIVGGALVPVSVGFLADMWGLTVAMASTAVCYGYILYFAVTAERAGEGTENPHPA